MNKILVIMPVYNTENYVGNAIESVLQQTHQNLHLIIIDDGSTDNSYEVIKEYESNERVTVLQNEENRGCYFSRNRGLTYLDDSYQFFTIHDSDDSSKLKRFEILLNNFYHNSHLLGLKTTYMRVDTNYNPIEPKDVYTSEGIAIFRKSVFDILGFYDNTRFGGDSEYWMRLKRYCIFNNRYKLGTSNDVLYFAINRSDGTNLTQKYTKKRDRIPYRNKIQKSIKSLTSKSNFYRNKFK